jgi:membrane-associated phospholipid phosphatase
MAAAKETTCSRVACFFVFSVIVMIALGSQDALPASEITCDTNGRCATNGFDVALTKILASSSPKAAGYISHGFTFGLSPILAFGSALSPLCTKDGQRFSHALQDSVVIVSSALTALGITTASKSGVKRQRPCFHYGKQGETEAANFPNEEWLSFFSGDATIAFVAFTSGLNLAKLRGRSYASAAHTSAVAIFKYWKFSRMALAGGVFASLGALLRIVGYMHWTTDVLTGVLVGSACGWAGPLLLFFEPQQQQNTTEDGGGAMEALKKPLITDPAQSQEHT